MVQLPQVEDLSQATQDSAFVVQLRTICDSVLYAYLSKVADTAEKRHYLALSYTAVENPEVVVLGDLDRFLNHLHKFKILDLHISVFHPYDLRVLLVTMSYFYSLSDYFKTFISDRARSKEFHYDVGQFHTLIATRYMRYLRTRSNSR